MKSNLIFLAMAATVLVACKSRTSVPAKMVPTVETISVAISDASSSSTSIGVIEESQSLSLGFRTAGNVKGVYVSEGSFVGSGQILAELDDESLQSAYDATKATLDQAEDAMARMKKLYEGGALPEMQWIEIQSKVQTARSMEVMARKSLEAAKLTAPRHGLILKRNVEAGENVLPGVSAFKLVNIDEVNAVFSVNEETISGISVGENIDVTLKSTGEVFPGKVTSRSLKSDLLSNTYDVRIRIINRSHKLLPGMICQAILEKGKGYPSFVLPQQAVLLNYDNSRFVWKVTDGKARLAPVQTGKVVNSGVEILSGISEGDAIVVEGMQKISDGMTVNEVKK